MRVYTQDTWASLSESLKCLYLEFSEIGCLHAPCQRTTGNITTVEVAVFTYQTLVECLCGPTNHSTYLHIRRTKPGRGITHPRYFNSYQNQEVLSSAHLKQLSMDPAKPT